MLVYLILAAIWVVIIPVYIYLLSSGKISRLPFVAALLTAGGGTLMILLGKSTVGYIGAGIFSVGSLMQIVDIAKRKK